MKNQNQQEIHGNFGKCLFDNCMKVMKNLQDNAFDIAFADPPYNIKFKGFAGSPSKSKKIQHYNDSVSFEDYRKWCQEWFSELKRISKRQIISPGLSNLKMWYEDQEITDLFAIFDKTGSFGSRIATFATFQPLLFMGKFSQGLLTNSMEVVHVFRSAKKHEWIHPTPRPFEVLENIFKQLKPESVIDPFIGSGTTAQVCESLGIQWLGIEINPIYFPDIEKKIKIGIRKKSQFKEQKTTKQLKLTL